MFDEWNDLQLRRRKGRRRRPVVRRLRCHSTCDKRQEIDCESPISHTINVQRKRIDNLHPWFRLRANPYRPTRSHHIVKVFLFPRFSGQLHLSVSPRRPGIQNLIRQDSRSHLQEQYLHRRRHPHSGHVRNQRQDNLGLHFSSSTQAKQKFDT